MEEFAQRFYEQHRQHRAGDGQAEKKIPATSEQTVQAFFLASEIEAGDVMGDREDGNRHWQPQQGGQTQGAVGQAEFAAVTKSLPDNGLKGVVAQPT